MLLSPGIRDLRAETVCVPENSIFTNKIEFESEIKQRYSLINLWVV